MGKFLIFLQLEPFPHYFVFTQALNLSNKKWKRAQLDQYIDKKTKTLWNNDVHPLKYGRIDFAILNISGARAIFVLFCVHQDTGYE